MQIGQGIFLRAPMDKYRFQCVAVAVAISFAVLLLHAIPVLGAALCSCSFGSFRAANFVINFCHDDAKVFRGLSAECEIKTNKKLHSVR